MQKKQTNCEINSYIIWLGGANKYGSLNCQFLKLVPLVLGRKKGNIFPWNRSNEIRSNEIRSNEIRIRREPPVVWIGLFLFKYRKVASTNMRY